MADKLEQPGDGKRKTSLELLSLPADVLKDILKEVGSFNLL